MVAVSNDVHFSQNIPLHRITVIEFCFSMPYYVDVSAILMKTQRL